MAEENNKSKPAPIGCQIITPDAAFEDPYDKIITKSDTSEQLEPSEIASDYVWIPKKINQYGLKTLVNHSTILPQCIRAYGSNIAGFGIGVKYKKEYEDGEETAEMSAEFDRVINILKMLGMEMDTKEILEKAVKLRETYGIAYIECIRNLEGNVVQIEYIKHIPSIDMTRPTGEYVEIEQIYGTEKVTRYKQFRKFRQTIGGKTVYFKEFGDPRIMDKRTGEYVDSLETRNRANELLALVIGEEEDYGEVRWIGQVLPQDGARRAEALNNNYFTNGRHIPLMIIIRGGSLTAESSNKVKQYLSGVRGENAQHGYLILETENDSTQTGFDVDKQPEIQVVPLASVLQKDELFQEYQDNARKKAQSAFLLPDLYVGYTTDFNRATAQTAMEVTEQQVFQTERGSINWKLNNKLLKSYDFKFCEVYLKAPDITNPDDISKILNVTERAGGLTPNQAKELTCKVLGKVSEDYDDDWGGVPLAYLKSTTTAAVQEVQSAILKAEDEGDEDIVPVLKAVKDALNELVRERESDV